jgi:diadenylate cyclase
MNLDFLPFRMPGVIDLIDILVMSYIIYKVLILIKGTRAIQMLLGILLLIVTYYLSSYLGLVTLKVTVHGIITYLPIAIIVVFQNEIRKILAKLGTTPIFQRFSHGVGLSDMEQVIKAADILSRERKGGLIVIQQEESLGQYIETGIELDSKISFDLLVNIFEPKTPLHDGAVIISGSRIIAGSCLLPLSANPNLPPHFGTRHRAAIGITEESDCVAIIISEETGKISFAKNGTIMHYREKTIDAMLKHLNGLLEMDKKRETTFLSKLLSGKVKQ